MKRVWNMIEQQKAMDIKKDAGKVAWGVILYQLNLFLCLMVTAIIKIIKLAMQNGGNLPDSDINTVMSFVENSGDSYIIAVAIGIPFLFRSTQYDSFFKKNKKMSFGVLTTMILFMLSIQFLLTVSYYGVEHLLNPFGWTISASVNEATEVSNSLSMFIYVSFIGPISEELIFRGFALRTFKKYGNLFAVVISSILFGFFHGNLLQGFFAVAAGMVFGYVAVEYSIVWSMILHIMNNCLFSELLPQLMSHFSDVVQNTISLSVYGIPTILSVVIILKHKNDIINYCKRNKTAGYKYAFMSIGVVLLCVMSIMLAFSGIEKC